MKLNIYLLSNPILKILSQYAINNSNKQNNVILPEEKLLSFLIFYESTRKWIHIEKLYIKKIKSIKTLYTFESITSYYLITNLKQTYSMLESIKQLIPQLIIFHIDSHNISEEYIQKDLFSNVNNHIIIFEKFINNYNIIDYLNLITKKYNILMTQITILSFSCHNKILDKIAQKYPKLNIYTTEIINKEI